MYDKAVLILRLISMKVIEIMGYRLHIDYNSVFRVGSRDKVDKARILADVNSLHKEEIWLMKNEIALC